MEFYSKSDCNVTITNNLGRKIIINGYPSHYILYLFLFFFLTSLSAWGQGQVTTIDLAKQKDGYAIEKDGTYIFTGKYTGKPLQQTVGELTAAITVVSRKNITATVILKNVTIKFNGESDMYTPLYFSDADKITLLLEGKNVISGGQDLSAICAPDYGELVIDNYDSNNEGVLEVTGGKYAPGIGTKNLAYFYTGQITIQGGKIIAKGGPGSIRASGIGASTTSNGGKILISGGTIIATGSGSGPGIGHSGRQKNNVNTGGSITITGGNVTAIGGKDAPGIGIGSGVKDTPNKEVSIAITGGEVTAIGGGRAPGIGKSGNTKGGSIVISGGVVRATGGSEGMGIGTYNYAATETPPSGDSHAITISGGTITATNGANYSGPSIAGGKDETFSTGQSTNPIIFSNGIGDTSDKVNWRGIIFENNQGYLYGTPDTPYSLFTDMDIPAGATLTIEKDGLIVTSGVTLTNNGTILNKDQFLNNGTIQNDGEILNDKELRGNSIAGNKPKHQVACDPDNGSSTYTEYVTEGEKPNEPNKPSHIFMGWYEKESPHPPVTSITKPVAVYATWKIAYTISLPQNPVGYSLLKPDGSSFSASDLQVAQGNDFAFKLQLEPDYNQSTPTVEADGVTGALTADQAGVYTILAIQANTEIRVSGVIKNAPPPPPAPSYYSLSIPTTLTGAILHGGGTYTVEEGDYVEFRIELDPNGSGEYPAVYANGWNSLRPLDAEGTYRMWMYEDTEIRIGEVPGYACYELSFPGDSVWLTDDTYYTGEGITVESLRADLSVYPFGSLIRLDAADTPHREFIEWFDGTTVRPYDLTVREGLEIKALFRSKSPVGNTPIQASELRITTAPGCIDLKVFHPLPVCVYSVTGVLLRQAWVSDTKRFTGLATGIYIVTAGEERHKVTVR